MAIAEILATIDSEIAKLQQARALLSGVTAPVLKRSPGRPRKIAIPAVAATITPAKKKRKLTPEGRKRIAEAVRRRWAAQKKAAAGAAK